MRELVLEIYGKAVYLGSRGITRQLRRKGHRVNRKRIQRIMRELGLRAQAPGPQTSLPNKEHLVYPYLLKDALISNVDEVWSTDITYVDIPGKGTMYLTAIIDWYSRYIVGWELSNSLDTHAPLRALNRALSSGRKPKIFNTDQGCQFTSKAFTNRLKENGIHISMDGKGRAIDNIYIERFWRTIKCESLRLWHIEDASHLHTIIADYIEHYNFQRCHSEIGDAAPYDIYISGLPAPDVFIKKKYRTSPLKTIDDICSDLTLPSKPKEKKSSNKEVMTTPK